VTVDAFLTCCARAGLTLKPEELDALRADGTVRRPYAAAPELVSGGWHHGQGGSYTGVLR
jgi:hypothetical protein